MRRKLNAMLILLLSSALLFGSCGEEVESSTEEIISEEEVFAPSRIKPQISDINYPTINEINEDGLFSNNVGVDFYYDNTASAVGFLVKNTKNAYIHSMNGLNEIFHSYENDYGAEIAFHKVAYNESKNSLEWQKYDKRNFSFLQKSFYTGVQGGVKGSFKDGGPLSNLLNTDINYNNLNVIVSDINEYMMNSEGIASEISKNVFAKDNRAICFFQILTVFDGCPYVYSNNIVDENGKSVYTKDSFKGVRSFFVVAFGDKKAVKDFRISFSNKLGNDGSILCGNNLNSSNKDEFLSTVFNDGSTLYYFYDYVEYGDGNSSFTISDYKKMLESSQKFQFVPLDYTIISYDATKRLFESTRSAEMSDFNSPLIVSSKNCPTNYLAKTEDVRSLFDISSDEFFYSLNYSICFPEESSGSSTLDDISLEDNLLDDPFDLDGPLTLSEDVQNKDLNNFQVNASSSQKIHIAVPVNNVVGDNLSYYVEKNGIEVFYKKAQYDKEEVEIVESSTPVYEYEFEDEFKSVEEVSELVSEETEAESLWEKRYFADLAASGTLSIKHLTDGSYVDYQADEITKLSPVSDYEIITPKTENGEIKNLIKKLEGDHIIFEIEFSKLEELSEDDMLTLRIPIKLHTRTRKTVDQVPDFIKYLSTTGTQYTEGQNNNDEFFQKTVDLDFFFNRLFANSLTTEEFNNIFDLDLCEVVINVDFSSLTQK